MFSTMMMPERNDFGSFFKLDEESLESDQSSFPTSPSPSTKEFMDLIIGQAIQFLETTFVRTDTSQAAERKRWCEAIREKKKEYTRVAKEKAQQDRLNACKYGSNWTCRLNAFLAISKKILISWNRSDLVDPFTRYCRRKLKTDWIPYMFDVSSEGFCPPEKNMKNKYFEREESLHYMFTTILDGIGDAVFGEPTTSYGRRTEGTTRNEDKILFRAQVVFGASIGLYMSNFQSGQNMYSPILCSSRRFEKQFPNVLAVIQQILVECPERKYAMVKRVEHFRLDTSQNLPWGCCMKATVPGYRRQFCAASELWDWLVRKKSDLNTPPVAFPMTDHFFNIPPPTVGQSNSMDASTIHDNPFVSQMRTLREQEQQAAKWLAGQNQQARESAIAKQTFHSTVQWVFEQVALGCPRGQFQSLVDGVEYEDHERMRQYIERAVGMGLFGQTAQHALWSTTTTPMPPMTSQQQQCVYGRTTAMPAASRATLTAISHQQQSMGHRVPMTHCHSMLAQPPQQQQPPQQFCCGSASSSSHDVRIGRYQQPIVPPDMYDQYMLTGEFQAGADDSVFSSQFGSTTMMNATHMMMDVDGNRFTLPSRR